VTTTRRISAVVIWLALLATACGSDDAETPAAIEVADPAVVRTIEAQPDAIACTQVNDQQTWGRVTRRASTAIADREQIPGLNRLRASQSLYFAMTEVCKGRPASFKPSDDAIAGVRSGTFRVQPPR
jgi:hypothetical protein